MYLIGMISLFSIVMSRYHWQQNNSGQIGGEISIAKSIWLGLALFYYFVFSIWWLFALPMTGIVYSIALAVAGFFYFRLIVQSVLMYVTKNWTTKHGIAFNGMGCLILAISLYIAFQQPNLQAIEIVFIGYLILLFCFQLTDSFYAYRFGQIVGDDTKGEKAIWFASKDPKFQKINQITALLNTAYVLLSLVLVTKILIV